jgi:cardiolipin synthase A/B
MSAELTEATCNWLCAGNQVFPAMLAAIDAAEESVRLETYVYAAGALGERFRDALCRARQRRLQVRVLVDGFGSYSLPGGFWKPLEALGGEVRRFNPVSLNRLGIRDHRKLLVCDQKVAFVGGFNIAPEYEGDGVTSGWCDLGLKLQGSFAEQLASAFEEMFNQADLAHKPFFRLRRSTAKRTVIAPNEQLLLSGPGRGRNPIKRALRMDLADASSVQIIVAYFLPTWRLRRQLIRIARRGGRVQLILAGKSDVAVARLAGQSLYRRLLRAGVEIYEYQPQILHAKLLIIDDVVYVGSANLDQRSLNINYELMVRLQDRQTIQGAREVFQHNLVYCRRVTLEGWRRSRSIWQKLKQHWAYWLLVRLDPYVARRQWRALRLRAFRSRD